MLPKFHYSRFEMGLAMTFAKFSLYIGGISVLMGLLFMLLNKPFSDILSEVGKYLSKSYPGDVSELVDSIFNREKMLSVLWALGVVFLGQGLVFLVVAWILKVVTNGS